MKLLHKLILNTFLVPIAVSVAMDDEVTLGGKVRKAELEKQAQMLGILK